MGRKNLQLLDVDELCVSESKSMSEFRIRDASYKNIKEPKILKWKNQNEKLKSLKF